MGIQSFDLAGVRIDTISYNELLEFIESSIVSSKTSVIGYANASVINSVQTDPRAAETLSQLDMIHPDGIGVHLALKYVYGKERNFARMTGSEFYPMLINKALERNWSFFFFGHDEKTLKKISQNLPGLKIAGTHQGFEIENRNIVEIINTSGAQILIVGLGFPLQEEWILKNRNSLDPVLSILVGDGIRVFAGTKRRGPVLLRKAGLEWLSRLLINPVKYWKRYLIGNPLFLYRIFRYKMAKLKKN